MVGEQQRLCEQEEKQEDGGEEQTEQHDKDSQPTFVTKHDDEEKHETAADQGHSAPLVTEAWQDFTCWSRTVPGPTGIFERGLLLLSSLLLLLLFSLLLLF